MQRLVKSLSLRRRAAPLLSEKPPLLMCGFSSEMVPGQGEARLNVGGIRSAEEGGMREASLKLPRISVG